MRIGLGTALDLITGSGFRIGTIPWRLNFNAIGETPTLTGIGESFVKTSAAAGIILIRRECKKQPRKNNFQKSARRADTPSAFFVIQCITGTEEDEFKLE